MNVITLKNDLLTVQIEDVGAQLSSVKNNAGTEYIWEGSPASWNRHAPLLFPVISRLKDNQYTLNGKTYTIPQHGFARNLPFTVVEHDDNHAVFTLTENEDTLTVFPFPFLLTVTYRLEGNKLLKSIQVDNTGSEEMFFEVGIHDGFSAPHDPSKSMDDWAVILPGVETIHPYGMDENAMITPKIDPITFDQGRIPLRPMKYGLDTFILDVPECHKASLVDENNNPVVTMDFPGFPYMGIWTVHRDFETRYVCIEPWSTLPDATFVGRGLNEKAGIRSLQPGKSDLLSYTTTFHC
jgi:galactose mutarotase-like enzyme